VCQIYVNAIQLIGIFFCYFLCSSIHNIFLLRFWNGTLCIPYREYGESCLNTYQCIASQDTICLNGQCSCSNTTHFYFDSSTLSCELKKSESSTCSQDNECLGNMICSSGQCRCANTSTHYFNESASTCLAKTLNNTACSSNLTCRTDVGLTCSSGFCLCTQPRSFYSAVSNSCVVCPANWILNGVYCYFYNTNARNWFDARTWCNSQGANLLNLRSQSDFEFFRPFHAANGDIWVLLNLDSSLDNVF
jgi:hypothetical protein